MPPLPFLRRLSREMRNLPTALTWPSASQRNGGSSSSLSRSVKRQRRGNRKTRSIIVTDSNHIILSAVHAETLSLRLNGNHPQRGDNSEKVE